jgi:NTE family protein
VLELSLFRVRSVAVADVLSVAAGAGYFAYILTNVLYLTSIWRYSILDAGLAVLPSAAMAALAAWPAGRAAERYGFRRVIVVGALLWCAGVVWWIIAMNGHRAYVSDFLLASC